MAPAVECCFVLLLVATSLRAEISQMPGLENQLETRGASATRNVLLASHLKRLLGLSQDLSMQVEEETFREQVDDKLDQLGDNMEDSIDVLRRLIDVISSVLDQNRDEFTSRVLGGVLDSLQWKDIDDTSVVLQAIATSIENSVVEAIVKEMNRDRKTTTQATVAEGETTTEDEGAGTSVSGPVTDGENPDDTATPTASGQSETTAQEQTTQEMAGNEGTTRQETPDATTTPDINENGETPEVTSETTQSSDNDETPTTDGLAAGGDTSGLESLELRLLKDLEQKEGARHLLALLLRDQK